MSDDYVKAMDFVAEFVKYFDEVGICDKFDSQRNNMVTSDGVYNMVKKARGILPPELKGGESAKKMRALDDKQRDAAIAGSGSKVVDARGLFGIKMAKNGAARGLLADIADAYESGDTGAFGRALEEAKFFTAAERQEIDFEKKDKND